jgi:hypothetical protein
MLPDEHTACPACAIQVRAAHEAGYVLVFLLEQSIDRFSQQELEAIALVHAALDRLTPLVRAHQDNQLHAFSPELAGARHPTLTEAA